MDRPKSPYVDWKWEWRNAEHYDGNRFHVWHFIVDDEYRGQGHGNLLVSIIRYAAVEENADEFSIQMGGGAHTARWLNKLSSEQLYSNLRVEDVQGYNGGDWRDPNNTRTDGLEDDEGDGHSSVYAELIDLRLCAFENGWISGEQFEGSL